MRRVFTKIVYLFALNLAACFVGSRPQIDLAHARELNEKCQSYLEASQIELARECYLLLLENNYEEIAYQGLGKISLIKNQEKLAQQYFLRSFELGHNESLFGLAIATELVGEVELADYYYRNLIELNPDSTLAFYNYAMFIDQQSGITQKNKIQKLLNKAVILNKDAALERFLTKLQLEAMQ